MPEITYAIAKKAIELFESEYIGQSGQKTWEWAVEMAPKVIEKQASYECSCGNSLFAITETESICVLCGEPAVI